MSKKKRVSTPYTIETPAGLARIYRGEDWRVVTPGQEQSFFWEPSDYEGGDGHWDVPYASAEEAERAARDYQPDAQPIEVRSEYLKLRLTGAEKERIAEQAAMREQTISDYARQAILGDAPARPIAWAETAHGDGERLVAVGCVEAAYQGLVDEALEQALEVLRSALRLRGFDVRVFRPETPHGPEDQVSSHNASLMAAIDAAREARLPRLEVAPSWDVAARVAQEVERILSEVQAAVGRLSAEESDPLRAPVAPFPGDALAHLATLIGRPPTDGELMMARDMLRNRLSIEDLNRLARLKILP